ncbi:MAG TPA: LysR family transcriptional regulator [Dehalococcoidia bacterium]|nr:LysR family transcriptional regulator [Dehalococcoidia bacterium]
MELYQLETFLAVAREQSFTRAGEILGLTQPAVTRQIAALERDLGVELIERRGRSFGLTAAGRVVEEQAAQVLAAAHQLRSRVQSMSSPKHGEVSVACVTTVGLHTLPSLVAEFASRYPDVRVRVWSGRMDGVIDRLLDGRADVGLVSAPVSHPHVLTLPLFDDPVIAVATPEFAEKLPRPLPVETLGELDLILFESPSRFRSLVDAALQNAGVLPRIAMELDSHEAVRQAVLLGRGLALVPQQAVPDDLASGRLVRIEVRGLDPIVRRTCLILRRGDNLELPPIRNFVWLTLARYASGVWRREVIPA